MNWHAVNNIELHLDGLAYDRRYMQLFCSFAAERQAIYWRRLRGLPQEQWTVSPVFEKVKFTNCYRILDRNSQYLIANISNAVSDPKTRFGQTYLFKMFNKIETWEKLPEEYKHTFDCKAIAEWCRQQVSDGYKLFSNAYLMCSPHGTPYRSRAELYLASFEKVLENWEQLMQNASLEPSFEMLQSLYGFGDFLAYQFAQDFAYGADHAVDFDTFVVPGPGCRRGMYRVFPAYFLENLPAVLKCLHRHQRELFAEYGADFEWLRDGTRTYYLSVPDIQNLFCEFEKYSRVHVGTTDVVGFVKNVFKPTGPLTPAVLPRSWQYNTNATLIQ